ncbi:chromosome-partitioning protein Spo0J [Lachnospiraceae bacterium]|nr:chromosome-partitioning protein Spo0J [Lachnospiraceae bacterium]
MADEKSKNLTGADGPDKDPAQPEAGGSPAPGKAQKAPEAAAPEKTVKEPEKATLEKAEKEPEKVAPQKAAKEPEKTAPQKAAKEPEKPAPEKEAKEPEKAAPAKEEKKPEIPKEQKVEAPEGKEAPNVSFYNFSEIMAGKKGAQKAPPGQDGKAPGKAAPTSPEKEAAKGTKEAAPKQKEEKGTEPPKRKGRPPKEAKDKAAPTKKEPTAKKEKAGQKTATATKAEKSSPAGKAAKAEKAPQPQKPVKAAPEVKPATQPEKASQAPTEAPRRGDEQIVYLKLSELHAFKDHPFQVRNDEEMKAMVSSVKDKGVTQPAIVRPREDGGYEIVSGHRRQKASELAGYADMPCIIRNLTDEQAITQMVEDNTNQRENILPSERAKALKMQLEAIKHQGAKNFTSGQLDPKDAGRRSNEVVAERNKMTVKQVQRYIKLNDLVPDLQKMMDEGRIKFTPAVEMAYIKPRNQNYIAVAIESQQSSPSLSQAQRMRELDQKGILNGDVIDGIMMEDKKEVDKVILTGAELGKYFGKETTPREMKDQIIRLLDSWKDQQKEAAKPEKKKTQPEK